MSNREPAVLHSLRPDERVRLAPEVAEAMRSAGSNLVANDDTMSLRDLSFHVRAMIALSEVEDQ
jgi:hypothetical protein